MHTSPCMVSFLSRPHRRGFHVLTLACDLGPLWIVVHHVSGTAAAGGVDVLLDGRGDEVLGVGGGRLPGDVSCK